MSATRLAENDFFGPRGDAVIKVKVLAPGILGIALPLTLAILGMITSLTLERLKNRKMVIVSYPCIGVKSDKWIRSAEVETRSYVVYYYDSDDRGLESVIAKR